MAKITITIDTEDNDPKIITKTDDAGYSADIDQGIPGKVDHLFRCKLTTPFRAN
jgi:hypothetical protein